MHEGMLRVSGVKLEVGVHIEGVGQPHPDKVDPHVAFHWCPHMS